MSNKIVSLKDLGKELEKQLKKDVDNVKKAAAKALNASARKARTAIAKQEAKTLGFKTKRFAKSIKINKAQKNNLNAGLVIPNNASEVQKDGKNYLMIPIKGYLKKIGYPKDQITRGMANHLLTYANANPRRTKKIVENPHPFFKIFSDKTKQWFIAARQQENRKKMNWLYVGKEGKEPDFLGTIKKVVNENLEKDFERELKKAIDKNK